MYSNGKIKSINDLEKYVYRKQYFLTDADRLDIISDLPRLISAKPQMTIIDPYCWRDVPDILWIIITSIDENNISLGRLESESIKLLLSTNNSPDNRETLFKLVLKNREQKLSSENGENGFSDLRNYLPIFDQPPERERLWTAANDAGLYLWELAELFVEKKCELTQRARREIQSIDSPFNLAQLAKAFPEMKEGIWTRIEQKFTQNSQGLIRTIPYAYEVFPDKRDIFWEIFIKNDGFPKIKYVYDFIEMASIFDQPEQKEYLVSRLVENPKQICPSGLDISDIKNLSEYFTEQAFLNQLFDFAVNSIGVEDKDDVINLAYLGTKSYKKQYRGFFGQSIKTKSSLLSNDKLDVLSNIIIASPEKFFKQPTSSCGLLYKWWEDLPFDQPQIQQLEEMARQFSERTPGANDV